MIPPGGPVLLPVATKPLDVRKGLNGLLPSTSILRRTSSISGGVDAQGAIVLRKFRRSGVLPCFEDLQPRAMGMEACAGAHFRPRELRKPGHEVRIMPPASVTPCVTSGKTGAAGAEAICHAGAPTDHAVRAREVGRAAGGPAGPRDRGLPRPPAHAVGEHDPGASLGVRHRRGRWRAQHRAPARGSGRSAIGGPPVGRAARRSPPASARRGRGSMRRPPCSKRRRRPVRPPDVWRRSGVSAR